MLSNFNGNSIVAQPSGQPAQGGIVEKVVDHIINNVYPVYPETFVQTMNHKTGIAKKTIRRLSRSIHKPQHAPVIQKMVGLEIAKLAIGKPNGNGDLTSQLQSHFHDKALPAAFDRMNDDMSNFFMPNLDCWANKPYAAYSHVSKRRLNIVAWSAVGYNLVQHVKHLVQA